MVAREILHRAINLAIATGLLACTAQQTERSPQPSKPSQVEPLTQLSPTFPNTKVPTSPENLRENQPGP